MYDDITGFYADVEKGTLIINIKKELLFDTISDRTSDFSVKV